MGNDQSTHTQPPHPRPETDSAPQNPSKEEMNTVPPVNAVPTMASSEGKRRVVIFGSGAPTPQAMVSPHKTAQTSKFSTYHEPMPDVALPVVNQKVFRIHQTEVKGLGAVHSHDYAVSSVQLTTDWLNEEYRIVAQEKGWRVKGNID